MKKPVKKEKLIGVRLEPEHYARIADIAKREDRTISAIARRIIVKALRGKRKKTLKREK